MVIMKLSFLVAAAVLSVSSVACYASGSDDTGSAGQQLRRGASDDSKSSSKSGAGQACSTNADCPAGLECEVEVEHGATSSFCKPHGNGGGADDQGTSSGRRGRGRGRGRGQGQGADDNGADDNGADDNGADDNGADDNGSDDNGSDDSGHHG
jgi:hypothetical protein